MNAQFTLPRNARANVLGIAVDAINLPGAVNVIEEAVRTGTQGYVCVTSVHGIMEARRSPEFHNILRRALLVTPDGMPTVWIGHLQGHSHMRRVFGPDLMMAICARAPQNQIRHFLYGGNPGVADELADKLQRMIPSISIVGTFTPPFRPLNSSEQETLQRKMEAVRPDVVWIGLSTPKQEKFMADYIGGLPCKIMIGVGAAFDIHTGRVKDAPRWVKSAGLQWAHRCCQEPKRLWKRYLVNNSAFLAALGLQLTGLRRYSLPHDHSEVSS
jgi:N-acetylglucosaminyldiphosphoundecaprenol N-acetyl-beta-D-mannosaminyltransferase